jgi:hypothetical protein
MHFFRFSWKVIYAVYHWVSGSLHDRERKNPIVSPQILRMAG